MPNRKQPLRIPPGFSHLEPTLARFAAEFGHIDRNVFIMMPFASQASNAVFKAISDEIESHGLVPLRADTVTFSEILWLNVATYMIGSSFGIAVYEPSQKVPYNPNVSIEAGFMTALDKPVLILANRTIRRLPTDFAGHVFKQYDSGQVEKSIRAAVRDWLEHDISYFNYGKKKLVLFASLGGTCRCVLAKGILSQILHEKKISNVVVEAAAIIEPHHPTISPSARDVLKEVNCDHWIEHHRPRKLSRYLQNRADLIITLSDKPLPRASKRRTKVLSDLDILGEHVMNPYPDNHDEKSKKKYRRVRKILEKKITQNLDAILENSGWSPRV